MSSYQSGVINGVLVYSGYQIAVADRSERNAQDNVGIVNTAEVDTIP